jgi:hypothetical protein
VLDAVFLWLAFSVNLQLLGSRVEYWELSNVLADVAVAVLRVDMYLLVSFVCYMQGTEWAQHWMWWSWSVDC